MSRQDFMIGMIICVLVSAVPPMTLADEAAEGQAQLAEEPNLTRHEPSSAKASDGAQLEPTEDTTMVVSVPQGDRVTSDEESLAASQGAVAEPGRSDTTLVDATEANGVVMQATEWASYVSVIITSFVVISGLNIWRGEFKQRRDMELAEEVLCLFYRAEQAIEAIRFPMFCSLEGQEREAEPDETPEEKRARDRAYATFKRIKDHAAIFDQLHAIRFRFMARFGRDKAKPFDDMKREVATIRAYTKSLAQHWAEKSRFGNNTHWATEGEIEEGERTIYYAGKDDPTEARICEIVNEIETICRPIINGQRAWLPRLRRKVSPTQRGMES